MLEPNFFLLPLSSHSNSSPLWSASPGYGMKSRHGQTRPPSFMVQSTALYQHLLPLTLRYIKCTLNAQLHCLSRLWAIDVRLTS